MKQDEYQSMRQDARVLEDLIGEARRIVVFTGAGVSTAAGVPDFRSPGSPWLVNKPLPFADFLQNEEARLEAWRRKFTMDDLYRHARPARAHYAITQWFEAGKVSCVITQNIDDLHGQSGLPRDRLIELHGNGTYAVCLDCGLRHELEWVRGVIATTHRPPYCLACDGIVKSATISFGQPLSPGLLAQARDESLSADLFLVMGSSLVVRPAASLPLLAKQAGAALVILNREATPLDDAADLIFHRSLEDILGHMMGVFGQSHSF